VGEVEEGGGEDGIEDVRVVGDAESSCFLSSQGEAGGETATTKASLTISRVTS
jgi:hypothetical protein